MKIVFTLTSFLAVILNSIELGSQSQQPADPNARIRSRSATLRESFPGVLGFGFEDLEFIRLKPHISSDRVFKLRKYVFPQDKPIGLKNKSVQLNPLPLGEQIVLSSSDGDAYAILEKTSWRLTVLRALCTLVSGRAKRAKINMDSGAVKELTEKEIEECPVTTKEAITKIYEVSRLGSQYEGSPRSNSNPSVHRGRPSSSSAIPNSPARSSPPAALPLRDRSRSPTPGHTFTSVFGHKLKDLEYVRLIPTKFPHQIYKLQRYTFPQDEPIGLMTINHVLYPMPTGVQIVLSTSNGDVCAILEKTQWRTTVVRPIFTSTSGILERVKINMDTGAVKVMTTVEIEECPGTATKTAKKSYEVVRL